MPARNDLLPKNLILLKLKALKKENESLTRANENLKNQLEILSKEREAVKASYVQGIPMSPHKRGPRVRPSKLINGEFATPVTDFGTNGLRTMKLENGSTFLVGKSGRAWSMDESIRLPNYDRAELKSKQHLVRYE